MIGLQPNETTLNTALGQILLAVRNDFQNVQNLNAYITAQGGAPFLQGLGFTAGDAGAYVAAIGNHDQLRQIYQGLAALAAPFNYEANGNGAWGGS